MSGVAILAGGTGGARLAAGLYAELPEDTLTVVANTADDDEFWGLHVSPDVDAVLYRLAGCFNTDAGFGVAGETFAMLEMLRRYGEDTWFGLGDRDTATHLLRTRALREGRTLTESTADLCARLGVRARILPMSDDPVRTVLDTDSGPRSLQEWFVRDRCEPAVRAVRREGAASARPSTAVRDAIESAERIVIGPSNPLLSVDPILDLFEDVLAAGRDRVVAVTPIVGGVALKGPTVEMLRSTGEEPALAALAGRYTRVASTFVIDTRDAAEAAAVRAAGMRPLICDTVMRDHDGERRLASNLLAYS